MTPEEIGRLRESIDNESDSLMVRGARLTYISRQLPPRVQIAAMMMQSALNGCRMDDDADRQLRIKYAVLVADELLAALKDDIKPDQVIVSKND